MGDAERGDLNDATYVHCVVKGPVRANYLGISLAANVRDGPGEADPASFTKAQQTWAYAGTGSDPNA
jgi:hypothetical protein